MKKVIEGKAFVLGNNVDTDQIIPAEHLVYSMADEEESKKYGHFALSSVPPAESGLPQGNIPYVNGDNWQSEFTIIIGGSNFGCGSSREHAPFALQKAGAKVVIAESYARIFYRNSVDGGFIVPIEGPVGLNKKTRTGDELSIDLETYQLTNKTTGATFPLNELGDVLPIIEAGGLFTYARQSGIIMA